MGTSASSAVAEKNEEKHVELDCSICTEEFKIPKLLPCFHTFCQGCLAKLCNEHDEEKVPCPLCRSEFRIPQGGVEKFPTNQFMIRLIQQKNIANEECLCDLCRGIGESIKADSFCMKCRQSLCQRCTWIHSKLNYAKQHKVVSIEEKPTDYEMKKLMSSYCGKHDHKELELYCCDCRELICALCHVKDHKKHDCKTARDIAKQKCDIAESDRKEINKYRSLVSERKTRLEKIKQDFQQRLSSTECSIRESIDTIRKLLDNYEMKILKELNNIKTDKRKKLENDKNSVELQYAILDSFHAHSSMVNERGTDCEIIRAADDLHKRAEELIRDQKMRERISFKEIQLKFIQPAIPTEENFNKYVGRIVYQHSSIG